MFIDRTSVHSGITHFHVSTHFPLVNISQSATPKSATTASWPWPVFTSHSAEGRRLSWPGYVVTYKDGIPAPISVLTLLDVD